LINPYGPVPGEGWRDYRFTLMGRALAARGHDVTWWTSNFAHQSKRYRNASHANDFKVELVPTPSYKANIGLGRLWFEFQFARRLIAQVRSARGPDVILAADPPQFSGWAGRRLAEAHQVPFVIDCLDLWPELFVNIAPALFRPFVRLAVEPLFALRRKNVRAASLTITVADRYRVPLERDGARRLLTIPIGVDISSFPERPNIASGPLKVVYAGTLGVAYDLMTVLEAFDMLQRDGIAIDLIVAGQGPLEQRLRATAKDMKLENVHFIGALAASELDRVYRSAGVGLAPYTRASTVAAPVKIFDYLAAGLPIVTSLQHDLGGAALRYEAGDPDSLRDVLSTLADHRDRLQEMSTAAIALRPQFDARVLYDRLAAEIEAVTVR